MFNFTKNKEVQQQEFKPLFYINPRPQVADIPEIKEKEKIDIKYVLIEPYVYAHIFWDKENNELVYNIEEPELDEKEAGILNLLENSINELINISFIGMKSTDVVIEYLEKNLRVLLSELKINITKESFLKLMYYIYRDFVGLNELEPLLRDYYIEDIECNGVNTPIYIVHRKYRNIRTNVIFRDIRKLTSFVEKVAQKCGKYISYASPLLDASLPDGSVDYEEPIIYKENGIVKISKIGEFVDKFYKDKESNKPISINDIEVPAFDNKTLKISWKKADYVYRHKNDDDLFELELEFGRKIKLTKYHSIFVLTKEGVKAKKTEEIKESDIVVAPLTIPENDIIKEINVAKELSLTKYANELILENIPNTLYINKKNKIYEFLKKEYKKPNQAYYEHKNKKILPLKLYNLLEEKDLRICKIKPTSAVSIPTFIKIDQDLIRFLGLYAAEGWLYDSSNVYAVYFSLHKDETDLIETIRNSSKNCFGLDIYVEPEEKNAVKVKVNSYPLWILLNEVLKVSKGASNKRIPELIFNIKKELQQEFLKYWRLGDYGSTSSKQLANDISYLSLFNNDIVPFYYRERESTFEKTRKTISHEYYTNFFVREVNNEYSKMIPTSLFNPLNQSNAKFRNKRINRQRIKKIIENIKIKINNNHPAFIHEWTKKGFLYANKPTNKFYELIKEFDIINKIAESDLGFFKINSIKRVKSTTDFVYDLSVKDHENFIGGNGGICCHNSRVNATYTQDISTKGPAITIRKFTSEPWSPIKLMQFKTLSPEMLSYLWLAIEHESNIMVIGGTGSGKTSLLNSIAFFIPPASRVVTIEDTRELNILHENWLPGVTRSGIGASNLLGTKEGEITLFDLLRESFRQRPDYLIVGEIRGREAYVLFQGMSSLRGDEEIFILRDDKPLRIKIKDLEKEDVSRLKAISYDVVNKKMEILPIKAFVRHPMRNKLYNIKTRFGREITVTPDHSLFTLDKNGKIIDIKTEEFKIGSKIIIPSTIPCGYNNIADLDLFEYLPDIRVFAPEYIKEASNKIGYYEASSLCNCASITDYYSDFKGSRPSAMKAEGFLKLMKEAEVNFDVNKIEFRYDKKSKSIKGNLEISDEFLRLLGYYISEGSLDQGGGNSRIQLYNKSEKVLEDMRKCIEKITGIKPEERITEGYGSCLELSFNHKVLFEFIKRYCKTKTEKRIPDFIFGLDKRRIGVFLAGLYCGDGTIDQKYFGYYTASKNLANDVSQLLLVYGIITRISKRNREGRKTTDYELIFYNSYKKEEFYKYVKPIGKEIELKLFKKTDFKLFGDLYCDEVKSIEILDLEKPEYVYDISVPGNQNFIGGFGAVLLHNSGHPSFGTMHAEDVETMVRRLATPPIELSPSLIESLDIVCIIGPAKVNNKEVRRVKKVVEIVKVKEGSEGVETNSPFVWDPRTDNFYFKEESKVFDKIMMHKGISKEKLFKEFTLRTKLLVALYKNNIMGFKEVNDIINAYYKTPEIVLKKFNIS